ncbi:hypothetical protein DVH05_007705 [Phytophthora capsici]|nr:hypothetical protein DVH05_007705 [Phytophthora capsici]
MRTRGSDAQLKKQDQNQDENSALAEVMTQLDQEDAEGEPSDSDSDYGDDGAGAGATNDTTSSPEEDAQENAGAASSESDADSDDREESSSPYDLDAGSSTDEDAASGSTQKRHRTGYRKENTKAARTARQSDECDDSDGAFLEGFSRRWSSWDAFYRAFEVFKASTYQQFVGRTSTSVESRNKQILDAVTREAKNTGASIADIEAQKHTQYIPEDWRKYCITLQCTHGRSQRVRGSGKRKHRLVRSTHCSAKVNARVVAGGSGWYIALNASGAHNHPVTKHQWFNYAEDRKITDTGLTEDAANMYKAGAHAKGILSYLREQSGTVLCASGIRPVLLCIIRFSNVYLCCSVLDGR